MKHRLSYLDAEGNEFLSALVLAHREQGLKVNQGRDSIRTVRVPEGVIIYSPSESMDFAVLRTSEGWLLETPDGGRLEVGHKALMKDVPKLRDRSLKLWTKAKELARSEVFGYKLAGPHHTASLTVVENEDGTKSWTWQALK